MPVVFTPVCGYPFLPSGFLFGLGCVYVVVAMSASPTPRRLALVSYFGAITPQLEHLHIGFATSSITLGFTATRFAFHRYLLMLPLQ